MAKIWQITSRICFDTTYYVVSDEQPIPDQVIELARDGYVSEFKQELSVPEYALHQPREVSEEEYLKQWDTNPDAEKISKEERIKFLINLDVKPPEDLSFAHEISLEDDLLK